MRDDTRPTAMPATMLAGLNIRGSSPTLWNPQVPSLYDVRPSLPLNSLRFWSPYVAWVCEGQIRLYNIFTTSLQHLWFISVFTTILKSFLFQQSSISTVVKFTTTTSELMMFLYRNKR